MFHILGKIPQKVYVAVSGGPDSMAILDFLKSGGKDITVLHFDHGTEHGSEARKFVEDFCNKNKIPLIVGFAKRDKLKNESPEEYWRNIRYDFFSEQNPEIPIILGHNLDDQLENYIFTSLHGSARLIPYKRDNFIRPFILNKKAEFLNWCKRKSVPYLEDPGNFSDKYMRSYIRTHIVPHTLIINPGIYKTIKRLIKEANVGS